jgi:hypothetical protein
MATPKEQCFQDAVSKYQDATGKDLGLKFEQPWVKGADGQWSAPNRNWWALVNSLQKFRRWLSGDPDTPVPGSVRNLRRPDITMDGPNGKPMVVDLKFTDKNGNPDEWHPGQEDAYKEINKQNQGDDADAISLDKNSCKCDGEPQPEEVADPAFSLSPFFLPLPSPGGVPVPALPPITIPEPIPIPIPIIP